MTNTNWAVELLEDNMEGMTKEERLTYLNDVQTYGCSSGCVSGAIYTHEIKELFQANAVQIIEAVAYAMHELDYNLLADVEPEDAAQQAVWYFIETTAAEMYNTIDDGELVPVSYNSNWDEE